MNEKIVNVAVDHGNRYIKTPTTFYENGLVQHIDGIKSDYEIEYCGEQYIVYGRSKYQIDRSKNDDYFILTFPAIADQMDKLGIKKAEINLSIGLPLSNGVLKEKYIDYFSNDNEWFEFRVNRQHYRVKIVNVYCFYQGLAAISKELFKLRDVAYLNIIDLGYWTCDVAKLINGRPDIESIRSIDFGMLKLIKSIKLEVRKIYGHELEEEFIESILVDLESNINKDIKSIIDTQVDLYIIALLKELRELDFKLGLFPNIFIGGGGKLLFEKIKKERNQSIKATFPNEFDNPILSNAKGYEYLLNQTLRKNRA